MATDLDDLRRRALYLVEESYKHAGAVARLDLDTINSVRPAPMCYQSRAELAREWLARAGALADFATNLGLITPDQALSMVLAFSKDNPDVIAEQET
jgi:hypothetical protein